MMWLIMLLCLSSNIFFLFRASLVIRQRVFNPKYQFEPFFRLTKLYESRKETTNFMRSFINDVLQKRIAEFGNRSQNADENDKRLRIFVDEIIQLSLENNECFSVDEMISESLTMLLAVKINLNMKPVNLSHLLATKNQ